MGPEISRQLAQLRSLSRGQLLELWEKHYGKTPPKIRRELLVPFLAYRMQQKRYGGLKTSTRTELRRIARRERASRTCSGPLHDQPVYLGHSFLTDLLLLRIPFREPLAYDPRYPWIQDALRTAAEALSLGSSRVLDVDPGELSAGYRLVPPRANEAPGTLGVGYLFI